CDIFCYLFIPFFFFLGQIKSYCSNNETVSFQNFSFFVIQLQAKLYVWHPKNSIRKEMNAGVTNVGTFYEHKLAECITVGETKKKNLIMTKVASSNHFSEEENVERLAATRRVIEQRGNSEMELKVLETIQSDLIQSVLLLQKIEKVINKSRGGIWFFQDYFKQKRQKFEARLQQAIKDTLEWKLIFYRGPINEQLQLIANKNILEIFREKSITEQISKTKEIICQIVKWAQNVKDLFAEIMVSWNKIIDRLDSLQTNWKSIEFECENMFTGPWKDVAHDCKAFRFTEDIWQQTHISFFFLYAYL
ncbi:hypothetical protein RFI_19862, partial [Reticulomyxa filosa]